MDSSTLFKLQSESTTRDHNFKIFEIHATCLPRRQFFSIQIVNDWNDLTEDITSTNLFKTHLDRFYYDSQYQFNIE